VSAFIFAAGDIPDRVKGEFHARDKLSIFLFPFAFIRFYSLFDKEGTTKADEAKGLPSGFAGSDLNLRLFANAHSHFVPLLV
jgi:hypothetical protein